MSLRQILLKENINSSNKYFRAVTEFLGEQVIFKPKGFYEDFDDDGIPQMMYNNVMRRSNIPEISASKTIGGALLGVWSMLNHYGKLNSIDKIYFYLIKDRPYKDLSGVTIDDYEYTKEVRYKEDVEGYYQGYYIINDSFNEMATNFYERFNVEPWDEDEYDEEKIKLWENFLQFIQTLDIKSLKKN